MVKTTKKSVKKIEPKAKSGTQRTPAKKSWYKQMWPKYWVMVSLALFLLLVLGYIGINKYQISKEKKQFDAAEAGLDTLYADIVKAVGQPTSYEKDVSCGYSSAKASKGFLSCGTSYYVTYAVKDYADLVLRAEEAQSILASNSQIVNMESSRDRYIKTGEYSKVANFDIRGFGKGCVAGFDEIEQKNTQFGKVLRIDFVCGGDAKAEHYQIKD